jgi:transcriptional regulator with XRE-family HTH domain
MNRVAIGRALRALRLRKRWRQKDLARRVGIGQPAISGVEAGEIGAVSITTLERLVAAVDAELVVYVRWRGGDLDRLLDAAHADLVERATKLLRDLGWEVHPEVSFSEFGERGSVDILAWHRESRTILVIEVKSEITAIEETLRRHDAKVRLAPRIAFERFGERPTHVARLLVLPDTASARRRLTSHAATFAATYPARGRVVTRWLAGPTGPIAGVLMLPQTPGTRRPRRIGRPAVAG